MGRLAMAVDRTMARWLVGLAIVCCAGCGGVTRIRARRIAMLPPAGGITTTARVLGIVRSRGYEVVVSGPERGRVGIVADYQDRWSEREDARPYRFAIECQGAVCSIRPIGPRVELVQNQWDLPIRVGEELDALCDALGAR